MEKISKERRDAIRAAAEKATPGPWEVGPVDDTVVTHLGADGLRYEVAGIDGDYNSPDEWPTMEANAAHIANCDPQTILALLDALDAAEKAEPVEWQYRDKRVGSGEWAHAPNADFRAVLALRPDIYEVRPLYTHPAPAVREGWVTVPVDPTEAMIEAAARAYCRELDIDPDYPHGGKSSAPAWWTIEAPRVKAALRAAMLAASEAK